MRYIELETETQETIATFAKVTTEAIGALNRTVLEQQQRIRNLELQVEALKFSRHE